MEAVRRWKQRRMGRVTVITLCIATMLISAYFVSLSQNKAEQEKVEKFWSASCKDFFTILSLQALESQSGVIEYGMYDMAGVKNFPDIEMALLTGGLTANDSMKILLASAAAEEENVEVASKGFVDDILIIDRAEEENKNTGKFGSLTGDSYFESDETDERLIEEKEALAQNQYLIKNLKKTLSTDYLIQNFYIVDNATTVKKSIFNVEKLIHKNCTMKKDKTKPQILIYHTHGGSEAFVDSKKGDINDSVVGVGNTLATILKEKYGYNVIHDKKRYDVFNGRIDRNKGYNASLSGVEKQLSEHPSIEVLIDLHRNSSTNNKKEVVMINGKETAPIMFFNGLSRNTNGDIARLHNPNLQSNLAFGLQLKLKAMDLYPDFTKRIYLKNYRYNLHLREKALLIELGSELNTVEEANNAMEPLARVLNEVLNE